MQEFDAIVGAIYDCAANPELWPQTLDIIRQQIGGAYALVGFLEQSVIDGQDVGFMLRHNSTWDEEWLLKLEAVISKIPQGGGMHHSIIDRAWTQLTVTEEEEFKQSEFYLKWVAPQKLRDTINTPYLLRPNLTGMLSIPCADTREPYGEQEILFCERITPHVRRAMLINDLTDKGRMATALYRKVLDSLQVAVFVVGLGQRLVFTNASADSMLSSAQFLQNSHGRLQSSRAGGAAVAFQDAVNRAVAGDVAVGITGIGVPLFATNGERAAAYVLPVAGSDIRGALGSGHCMVFVARRGEQQPMALEVLRTLFDLTPAEARIALMIANGDGPQLIATSLALSVNTVRSHLGRTFAKTRTADQTSLGSLINAILPPVAA